MKAKKKPIVLDVWQVVELTIDSNIPEWIFNAIFSDRVLNESREEGVELVVTTLEGKMEAKIGDYIVKGTKGEIWPVRKDIFEETYDIVEGE
ncbi:hypothetical protein PAF15_01370 [Weissella koreensis]|uniref:hypothetical protein n=1 Tax=Weissella koreensis TaxID=165096 RepID=UPI0022BA4397|nr:hypothetical protein [Weissella koreensis]MCZ9310627.1 hypothetical protein [Weissella koreensis]